MRVDDNSTDTFQMNRSNKLFIAVGSLAMAFASFAVAWPLMGSEPSLYGRIISWLGTFIFAAIAIGHFWGWFYRSGSTALTLSHEGLRDTRFSPQTIPWKSIDGLRVWGSWGNRAMVLKIRAADRKSLELTWPARMALFFNRPFGLDGVWITTAELGISFDDLRQLITEYARAHGGKVE